MSNKTEVTSWLVNERWDVLIQKEHQISIRTSTFLASQYDVDKYVDVGRCPIHARCTRTSAYARHAHVQRHITKQSSIAVLASCRLSFYIHQDRQQAVIYLHTQNNDVIAIILSATLYTYGIYTSQEQQKNTQISSFHFDDNCRVSWLYKHKHLIICFLIY